MQAQGCGQIQTTDTVRTTHLHDKLQHSSSSIQLLQLLHSCSQAAEQQSKQAAEQAAEQQSKQAAATLAAAAAAAASRASTERCCRPPLARHRLLYVQVSCCYCCVLRWVLQTLCRANAAYCCCCSGPVLQRPAELAFTTPST